MRIFMIFGSKLDENVLGRVLDLCPRKVHPVTLVSWVNGGKFGTVAAVHFDKEFKFRERFGGVGWGRIWPQG